MSRKIVSSPPTVINILITTHGSLSSIQTYGSRSNSSSKNISTVEKLKVDPSSSLKLNHVNLDQTGECSSINDNDMNNIITSVSQEYTNTGSIFSQGLTDFLNEMQEQKIETKFSSSKKISDLEYSIASREYSLGDRSKMPSLPKSIQKGSYRFVMHPHSDSLSVINKTYDWNSGHKGVLPFIIYTSDIELKSAIFNAIYNNTETEKTLFILINDILKVCEQMGITNIELNIIDISCNALTQVANAKFIEGQFYRVGGVKKYRKTRRKMRKGTKRRRKTRRRN